MIAEIAPLVKIVKTVVVKTVVVKTVVVKTVVSKDSSSKDNKSGFLSSFTGDLRSSLDSNNSSNLKKSRINTIYRVIQVDNNIGRKEDRLIQKKWIKRKKM